MLSPSPLQIKKGSCFTLKEPVRPFIRWAGGKQNLIRRLTEYIPKGQIKTYYEPFLGGGSMFLHNNFKSSVLSDINPNLINAYNSIKCSLEELAPLLQYHKKKTSEEYYYKARAEFNKNKLEYSIKQASLFIYLVHSSFNGIYRVNKKGEYNVPFGKPKPAIPDLDHLTKIRIKLKNAQLHTCMYEDVIHDISKGDFVYIDPPYPPLNNTSFFQHYDINKFPLNQQIDLSENANLLSKKGALVMISNADTREIRKLYKQWNIQRIPAFRYINCKPARKSVMELVITNY